MEVLTGLQSYKPAMPVYMKSFIPSIKKIINKKKRQKSLAYQLKTRKIYRQAIMLELKITSNKQSCSDFVSFFYHIFFTISPGKEKPNDCLPFFNLLKTIFGNQVMIYESIRATITR